MKRILVFFAIVLFFAVPVFADEAILIDFSLLTADIINDDEGNPTQNRQTVMNYADVKAAGSNITDEQRAAMKTSLAIENWEVVLASSSKFVDNITKSYTKEADSKLHGTVMGLRIHFPIEYFNSWAIIKPPFEIPAFEPAAGSIDDDGNIDPYVGDGITAPSRFEAPAGENGKPDPTQPAYGVIKNVGTIKSLAVSVYGLNFPHGLFLSYIDSSGDTKEIFMGYLQYDGWRELVWNNPAYVMEVRNRDLRLYPLYPSNTPFIKFAGFRIARDAAKEGGDFVGYFKDVKVVYDKAQLDTDRDIDDEGTWGIIRTRETARKLWEMERFGQDQVIRYQEQQKKAKEFPFDDPRRQEQQ
jgi:hypothetical protein